LSDFSTLRRVRGALGRWRREVRRRVLEPILVSRRSFRETVLNALAARGHLIYCRLPEGSFFVDPSDRVVASWLMWHGGWQRREFEQAAAILVKAGRLPQHAVFVDAGANIGTQTVYALRSGYFARAIAFEPEPRNVQLLAMNVAANGLTDRTVVVARALGEKSGQEVMHLHPRNKGAHAIGVAPSIDGLASVAVPMVRLDAALAEAGVMPDEIGLIWIDAEGYEPEVVGGLGDFIGRVPLAIEFTPRRYAGARGENLRRLLAQHYTRLYRLGTGSTSQQPIEAVDQLEEVSDILVL
jgi:FkbM family methyltransferase